MRGFRPLVVPIILAVGPIWFLWPAYTGRVLYVAPKSTDLSGWIQFQQLYSGMATPFAANNFVNYPDGQTITRWQEMTQIIPRLFFWAASKIVSPHIGLAVFISLGMIGTGLLTYHLCRQFGARTNVAVLLSMWVQLSPAMLLRATNHANYTHWWVLLLTPYLILRRHKQHPANRASELTIVGSVLLAMMFDPYYAWFVIPITTLVLLAVRRSAGHLRLTSTSWRFTSRFLLVITTLTYLAVGVIKIGQQGQDVVGRPLEVTPRAFVDVFSSDPRDWFRPNPYHRWLPSRSAHQLDFLAEYSAWIGLVGIVGLFGIVVSLRRLDKSTRKFVYVGLGILGGSALPTVYNVYEFSVSGVSDFLRVMFPGVRFFSRLSNLVIVALAIGVSVMDTVFRQKIARSRGQFAYRIASFAVLIVGVLEFWPTEYRTQSTEVSSFRRFANEIEADGAQAFFFFPMTGYERIIQNYLDVPIVNPLFPDDPRFPEMQVVLSQGPDALADEIIRRGATHVVTIKQDVLGTDVSPWNRARVNYDLNNSSRFKKMASARVYGSYLSEQVVLEGFRVIGEPHQIAKSRTPEEVGIHAYSQMFSDLSGNDEGIFWSYSGDLEVGVTRHLVPKTGMILLTPTLISEQTLLITTSRGARLTVRGRAGDLDPIYLDPGSDVDFRVRIQAALPCSTPKLALGLPDERQICFGLKKDREGNVLIQQKAVPE